MKRIPISQTTNMILFAESKQVVSRSPLFWCLKQDLQDSNIFLDERIIYKRKIPLCLIAKNVGILRFPSCVSSSATWQDAAWGFLDRWASLRNCYLHSHAGDLDSGGLWNCTTFSRQSSVSETLINCCLEGVQLLQN